MSDERDSAGSAGAGTDAGTDAGESESQGQTAVVTRPARPTGKRARRAVEVDESESDTVEADSDAADSAADAGKKAKPKKAEKSKKTGPTRNPFVFVWNFLKQVVAELRKVIWPNRKQMIGYTTVVLVFLVFMVALIGGVDFGLAKLVMWVFG
ncbi:preprotein translocase subunit SecE [Mycolicibacterium llatzerense]|uniref:preprotein translocase subunit SecE n=1 Tax=Mycolicibacterium llatzerense TaxID=280871 RepID=UPI0021B6160E|nr:preprotein translocase subunit SecE [Mycolicibacterium llatzerense]MCT7363522.1 preprotein translocase subunit SecE [Mycolicibacterium llatzerense]